MFPWTSIITIYGNGKKKLTEKAQEREERLALPDEERKQLEEEETEKILKEIHFWHAILHCFKKHNQKRMCWSPPLF